MAVGHACILQIFLILRSASYYGSLGVVTLNLFTRFFSIPMPRSPKFGTELAKLTSLVKKLKERHLQITIRVYKMVPWVL